MDAFTSSEEELNKADIQRKSAAPTWNAQLDSKGRVTVPARVRDRLDVEKGDELALSISSVDVVNKKVASYQEALEFVKSFQKVRSFSFEKGVVEVILDG